VNFANSLLKEDVVNRMLLIYGNSLLPQDKGLRINNCSK
jgi:hypothetical protein